VGLKSVFPPFVFLIFSNTILQAAPMLRLSSATIGPLAVASAGVTNNQTLEAFNAGDGSLNLKVDSSAPWITTTMGAQRNCRTILTAVGQTCSTIQVAINTTGLPAGVSTGFLTISDPNAIDAPQTVTVTVRVGTVSADAAPGGTPVDVAFATSSYIFAAPASQADWLSVESDAFGSFRFDYPSRIRFKPSAVMAQGTYTNSITISGGTNPADNQTIPVSMRVTTQPIAVPGVDRLRIHVAEGGPKLEWPISPSLAFTNPGAAALKVDTPSVTGAPWLKFEIADPYVANGFHFIVDPTGLAAGSNSGTIAFPTNSVNGTVSVPVDLTVVPKGPPLIYYQQVLNNATFVPGETVGQGDIVVIKGEQLSYSAFTFGPAPPLATKLGGVSVLVNGVAAPLFYTSYSQIAFQIPVDTALGNATIQAQRDDGSAGNKVSVQVAARAPRVIVVTNQNGSVNAQGNPAKAGEVITLWSIGLGGTSPFVGTGAAAPSAEPFARVTPNPSVAFGSSLSKVVANPQFAALAPGFAGLYQVNVVIPADSPKGAVSVQIGVADTASNSQIVYIQ
jgi:uncharacterized protein (TIGR03437 family)